MSVPTELRGKHKDCDGAIVFRPAVFRRELELGETVRLRAACQRCGVTVAIEYALGQPPRTIDERLVVERQSDSGQVASRPVAEARTWQQQSTGMSDARDGSGGGRVQLGGRESALPGRSVAKPNPVGAPDRSQSAASLVQPSIERDDALARALLGDSGAGRAFTESMQADAFDDVVAPTSEVASKKISRTYVSQFAHRFDAARAAVRRVQDELPEVLSNPEKWARPNLDRIAVTTETSPVVAAPSAMADAPAAVPAIAASIPTDLVELAPTPVAEEPVPMALPELPPAPEQPSTTSVTEAPTPIVEAPIPAAQAPDESVSHEPVGESQTAWSVFDSMHDAPVMPPITPSHSPASADVLAAMFDAPPPTGAPLAAPPPQAAVVAATATIHVPSGIPAPELVAVPAMPIPSAAIPAPAPELAAQPVAAGPMMMPPPSAPPPGMPESAPGSGFSTHESNDAAAMLTPPAPTTPDNSLHMPMEMARGFDWEGDDQARNHRSSTTRLKVLLGVLVIAVLGAGYVGYGRLVGTNADAASQATSKQAADSAQQASSSGTQKPASAGSKDGAATSDAPAGTNALNNSAGSADTSPAESSAPPNYDPFKPSS